MEKGVDGVVGFLAEWSRITRIGDGVYERDEAVTEGQGKSDSVGYDVGNEFIDHPSNDWKVVGAGGNSSSLEL